MNNSLDKLIGFQIVSLDPEKMVLQKGEQVVTIDLEIDDGDCCGYAHISTDMYVEPNSSRNPIITNIEHYENSDDEAYSNGENRLTITFYGEQEQLAHIEAEAGSGSGWRYGACATVECSALDINLTLAMW